MRLLTLVTITLFLSPTSGVATTMKCTPPKYDNVCDLFTYDVNEIRSRCQEIRQIISDTVQQVLNVPKDKRTFENVMVVLDELEYQTRCKGMPMLILIDVYPIDEVRNVVSKEYVEYTKCRQEKIRCNPALYKVIKEYSQNLERALSPEESNLLKDTIERYERKGTGLNNENLEQFKKIKQRLIELGTEFRRNIAEDKSSLAVNRAALKGMPDEFIDAHKKDGEDDVYILGTDYPTAFALLDECSIESTRKDYARKFGNRAYPKNLPVLKELLALRAELATLLGYKNYAEYYTCSKMAKTPARVREFVGEMLPAIKKKGQIEYQEMLKDLPDGVALENGKIKSWDVRYVKNWHKKMKLSIDEEKIAEYFPVDHTLPNLLGIYKTFLGIQFDEVKNPNLWAPDVQLMKVTRVSDSALLGHLILDLYPREKKYKHACCNTFIPARKREDGSIVPSLAIVIANFPKPQKGRPALFKFYDVNTFFHELGHAMHAMLGTTRFCSHSGTNVKWDFVETPSQMFEEFIKQPEVLERISKHYITGETLPADIVECLNGPTSGDFLLSEVALTNISLELHADASAEDLNAFEKRIHNEMRPYILHDNETHTLCSFGHLDEYAAGYYGYLWSKVFALDLFETVKKEGVLSGKAGQRLVNCLLGQGGTRDANELMEAYLGRPANAKAFLKQYGFVK